jgi:hypothetical protein
MTHLWIGFGAVGVVCMLIMILGLEMKINAMARRIEQKLDQLAKTQDT